MATTNGTGRSATNAHGPSEGATVPRCQESSAPARRCTICVDVVDERRMGPLARLVGRAGWAEASWCRRCRAFAVLELAGRELAGALREFEARLRRMRSGRAS